MDIQQLQDPDDPEYTLTQRFLLLVQALSGIRALTAVDMTELDEQQLLHNILDVLLQNLDLEKCSIFLLEGDELVCAAGLSHDDDKEKKTSNRKRHSHTFRIGEGAMGMAAKTGALYHARNCRTDNNYLPIIHPDSDKHPGAVICTPIMLGDTVLGVLNVSHPEIGFFHAWQEHVLVIHANILAQMLNNLRLMKDMRQEVNKRTQELEHALNETEVLKKKYETLSVIDDLTRIHNRRHFFTEAPKIISHCRRANEPVCILLVDLDEFKFINDQYGHDMGDIVLKDVAAVLQSETRAGDIVARIGGEEFAFTLQNSDLEGAKSFANRLRKTIAGISWEHSDKKFSLTASIGIATVSDNRTPAEDALSILFNQADAALYNSKAGGRNQVNVFSNTES